MSASRSKIFFHPYANAAAPSPPYSTRLQERLSSSETASGRVQTPSGRTSLVQLVALLAYGRDEGPIYVCMPGITTS